jgi:hypothetical protein
METLNGVVLETVRRLKRAIAYRNTYQLLLHEAAPQSADPNLAPTVRGELLRLDQTFEAVEERLAAGFDPMRALQGLIEALDRNRI